MKLSWCSQALESLLRRGACVRVRVAWVLPAALAAVAFQHSLMAQTFTALEAQAFGRLCGPNATQQARETVLRLRPTAPSSFQCVEELLRAIEDKALNTPGLTRLGEYQLWNLAEALRIQFLSTGKPHELAFAILKQIESSPTHPLRKQAWLALTLSKADPPAGSIDFELLNSEGLFIDPDEDLPESADLHPLYRERLGWYLATFMDWSVDQTKIDSRADIGSLAQNLSSLVGLSDEIADRFLTLQLSRRRLVRPADGATEDPVPTGDLLPAFQFQLTGVMCPGRDSCEPFTIGPVKEGSALGPPDREWRDSTGGTTSNTGIELYSVVQPGFGNGRRYAALIASYVRGGFRNGDDLGFVSAENQTSKLRYTLQGSTSIAACKSIAACRPIIYIGLWLPSYPASARVNTSLTISQAGKPVQTLTSPAVVRLDRSNGALELNLIAARDTDHVGACCEDPWLYHHAVVSAFFAPLFPSPQLESFQFALLGQTAPTLGTSPLGPFDSTLPARDVFLRSRPFRAVSEQVVVPMGFGNEVAADYVPYGEIMLTDAGETAQFSTRSSTLYARLVFLRQILDRGGGALSAEELRSVRQGEDLLSVRARAFYTRDIETALRKIDTLRSLLKPELVDDALAKLLADAPLVSLEKLSVPTILRETVQPAAGVASDELMRLVAEYESELAGNNRLGALVALQELRGRLHLLSAVMGETAAALKKELEQLK